MKLLRDISSPDIIMSACYYKNVRFFILYYQIKRKKYQRLNNYILRLIKIAYSLKIEGLVEFVF